MLLLLPERRTYKCIGAVGLPAKSTFFGVFQDLVKNIFFEGNVGIGLFWLYVTELSESLGSFPYVTHSIDMV
jgi:hypothetical protein